jgi:hypothetical protein
LLALGTSSCKAFILSAILSLRSCKNTIGTAGEDEYGNGETDKGMAVVWVGETEERGEKNPKSKKQQQTVAGTDTGGD